MFEYGLDLLDILLLLLTAAISLYLFYRFYSRYQEEKAVHDISYMVSFASLALGCVLLTIFGFGSLDDGLSEIIGVLVPAALALGLTQQFTKKLGKVFFYFAVVGLVLIIITAFFAPDYAGYFLLLVHLFSELIILIVPIAAVIKKKTRGAFISVSVGGLLFFITGLALAMLSTGMLGLLTAYIAMPILLALSLILFLMILFFAYGFARDIKHQSS